MDAFTENRVIELSKRFHEPDWLSRFRLNAFQYFLKLPLETSPLYTKYTSVSAFDSAQFTIGTPEESIDLNLYKDYLRGKESNIILQGNSTAVHLDLDQSLVTKGVEVMSIHDAISKRENFMKEVFKSKLARSEDEKYAAFNNALFNSGTFVYIPKGVEIESTIRKMLLIKNPSNSIIEQTIIYAEEGSKLNFLEELYTKESAMQYLVSSVLEVWARDGAHIDVNSIQLLDDRAVYLSNRNLAASNDSEITTAGIFLGSWITRSRMNLIMNGRGSSAEGFEVFFCNGSQRYDFETNLLHNSPDSTAATHARGVLNDESQSIFKGMIKILDSAKNSNSYLAHHAMLLDKRARSDGIPGLSIDTNQVKATHSASVAQIDEEQIFYLMTRGLSSDEAKKMIVIGFFEPILARLPVEIAREGARFMLEGKWRGERRRLVDREALAPTGESHIEAKQTEDIFERHYKYRK
jgi:Fe-S cluster assembly protein SufB/Fe-S cluster assembly protein SufD